MRKITFILALICIAVLSTAQSLVTNWTYTVNGGNEPTSPVGGATLVPAPPASGSTRNIAVGNFNGNDRMFVFTRVGATQVLMYETANGTYVGSLNATGITGGLVTIGDGEVTEDGKLLMGNVADGTKPFKVYKWDNETDAPTVVIEWTVPSTNAPRYGDKIYITGNYTTGTAKVYAPNKKLGYSKVLCWSMIPDEANPGTFKFNNTPTETVNVFGNSTQPYITTTSDGNFYYKDSEKLLCKYDAAGDSIGQAPNTIIRSWGTTVQFVCKDGNDDILAYFKYRSKATTPEEPAQEKVDILRVPGGDLSQVTVIGTTPSLGTVYNLNGWGDIVVRKVGPNAEIFVHSATNGFGKFTINNFLLVSSYKAEENAMQLIQEAGRLTVDGATVSSIEMYNSVGQLVGRSTNSNSIASDGISGLHIITVKAEDNQSKTFKVVL